MSMPNPPVPANVARVPAKPCGCCWRTHDDEGKPLTLGALAMPGRRTFLICNECVSFLWHARHPMSEASEDDGE